MTNTELVTLIAKMFADYLKYFMPVFGLLAGINLVLNWLWSITFKPFNRM